MSRICGVLLLSCRQASVAELRRQTLAPDEDHASCRGVWTLAWPWRSRSAVALPLGGSAPAAQHARLLFHECRRRLLAAHWRRRIADRVCTAAPAPYAGHARRSVRLPAR
jgi:hypothetical protein